MILHVKPTAKKDQVFRFKSNFIRFFKALGDPKLSTEILTGGLEQAGDGVSETCQNILGYIQETRNRYSKLCEAEIRKTLVEAAKELNIPLD